MNNPSSPKKSSLSSHRLGKAVPINIPSASGITKYKDMIYAVGDNSPFLFRLDLDGNEIDHFLLLEEYSQMDKYEIIEKPLKPDFESMVLVDLDEIYIFGSGSKSPVRDELIIFHLEDLRLVERIKLTDFYSEIKKCAFMKDAELNIEGTAYLNNRIYFFNRSNNCFFDYSISDFNLIIRNKKSFFEPRSQFLELPILNHFKAGVSGATAISGQNQILFTASVEATDNAYDDGEILGSYIGLLSLDNDGNSTDIHIIPMEEKEGEMKLKVESICVNKKIDDTQLEVILVTDNDGKASTFFKCIVELSY